MSFFKKSLFLIGFTMATYFQTNAAHAYLVEGNLCFVQPQSSGPVLENQISSFTPSIGKVSPTNLQQSNETLAAYVARLNESYRTTSPEVFAAHEQTFRQLKSITNAHVTPILKESYASRYHEYCYLVPLAYTETANDGSITLVQTPFYNLKPLEFKSAVNWFALISPSLSDFLNLETTYSTSPTTKLLIEELFKLGDEMILASIDHTCRSPEFGKNTFCQNQAIAKMLDPSAFKSLATSEAFKHCLDKQGGIIRKQQDFESCINEEQDKMSFGGQIEKYNGWIFEEIKKGEESTFNGIFALLVTLPIQPILWTVMYAGQSKDRSQLGHDLSTIKYSDFILVRQTVLNSVPEMKTSLNQLFWTGKGIAKSFSNRDLLFNSSLSQLQKRLVWQAVSELIEDSVPFGNIEFGTSKSLTIKKERLSKILETVGAQKIWNTAHRSGDHIDYAF